MVYGIRYTVYWGSSSPEFSGRKYRGQGIPTGSFGQLYPYTLFPIPLIAPKLRCLNIHVYLKDTVDKQLFIICET